MSLLLTYDDVVRCVTMSEAIAAVEDACREQAEGRAIFAERLNLKLPNGWIRLMPAALTGANVLGYKEFHLNHVPGAEETEAEVRYAFHLFDYRTGRPLASMDANLLTAIRTGATAGVAVKYMAPADAAVVGIIGSGAEARTELDAVAAVRPIRKVRVFSRDAKRRQRFADEMSQRHGVEVIPVERPQDVIDSAQILIAATQTTGQPALLGEWLPKGLHINSVGSTLATQREIDPEVWRRADRVVVDTRKVLSESGDAIVASKEGALDESRVAELQDIVVGKAKARASADETTLYKSVGTGLQDVAVAFRVYERAKALGLGQEVPDFQSVKKVIPN